MTIYHGYELVVAPRYKRVERCPAEPVDEIPFFP